MHEQETEAQPSDLPFQEELGILESVAGHNRTGTEHHHEPHERERQRHKKQYMIHRDS
jgi:hypothetical protein